jgi:hypothetical protein
MAEKKEPAAIVPGGEDGGTGKAGEANALLAAEGAEEREDHREDDPVLRAQRELERAADKLADAKDNAKRNDEIAKAIEQYRAVQLRLEAEQTGLVAQLGEGLEDLAPTQIEKDAVRIVEDEVKQEIDDLRDSIKRRSDRLDDDRTALARGKIALAETKDAFEGLKNRGKGVQDKHRAAEALVKEAFDAIPKKRRLAYYLLEDQLKPAINRQPHPIEVADFIREIGQKSADYGRLSRRFADLEASIKRREKTLADDDKKLADLRKNREATIRQKLAALA